LLVGKFWDLGAFARVFNRDGANLAIRVEVQQRIFIEILCLSHIARAKFDMKRVGILKVFYFHGLYVRDPISIASPRINFHLLNFARRCRALQTNSVEYIVSF
jgi:hypothetical protein